LEKIFAVVYLSICNTILTLFAVITKLKEHMTHRYNIESHKNNITVGFVQGAITIEISAVANNRKHPRRIYRIALSTSFS